MLIVSQLSQSILYLRIFLIRIHLTIYFFLGTTDPALILTFYHKPWNNDEWLHVHTAGMTKYSERVGYAGSLSKSLAVISGYHSLSGQLAYESFD